jgi:hypothetical protein
MKHGVTILLDICGIVESNEKEEKTRRDFTYYVHDDSVVILEFARITCLKCQKANCWKLEKLEEETSFKSVVQVYGVFSDENRGSIATMSLRIQVQVCGF